MKICHATPTMGPSYGGPFQSVRKLAKAQVEAGLDVSVRMPWSAEAQAYVSSWAPVSVCISGRILIPQLGWSPEYGRIICRIDADILHTHGIWQHSSWGAIRWKKRSFKPHVVSVRGMLEDWAWHQKAWKKRIVWSIWEYRNLQSASLLHATSEEEGQALKNRGLTAPIAVIPNGVDIPDEIKVINPSVLSPQKKGLRTALFLSRIHPKKGLPLLLKAWAKVKPEEWELHIVGPDELGHRKDLQHLVHELGISDFVRFSDLLTGKAKEQAFAEAELFVLPTHSENFGIAIAEALARGLPVITTHGAPWKMLPAERCGWWVPINTEGIAVAIEEATRSSPEDLLRMGAMGRNFIAQDYAWDRIEAQFANCYRWILGEGPKPDCVL